MLFHLFIFHHGAGVLPETFSIQQQGNQSVPPGSVIQVIDRFTIFSGTVTLLQPNTMKPSSEQKPHIPVKKSNKQSRFPGWNKIRLGLFQTDNLLDCSENMIF